MNAHRIAALIALLTLAATEIFAQQVTPLVPGTRVRVGVPTVADHRGWRIESVEHLTGTVGALRGDTLFVDVGGSSPTPVALSRVSTIEISHGTKSNVGKGAPIGAMIRSEGWQQIPLSGLRVQPSPVTGDGLAISASLRL